MRAYEFIPHDLLLETQLTPDQVRTRQRAWLWAELQNLLHLARKAAAERIAKPSKPTTHERAWKKPRKPKAAKPRRRKPTSSVISPMKPKVLADPARAQRRVAALFRR